MFQAFVGFWHWWSLCFLQFLQNILWMETCQQWWSMFLSTIPECKLTCSIYTDFWTPGFVFIFFLDPMCFSKLRTARMSGDRSEFDTAQDARLKCPRAFQSGILGCALIYVYERVFSCIATDDHGCLTRKKTSAFWDWLARSRFTILPLFTLFPIKLQVHSKQLRNGSGKREAQLNLHLFRRVWPKRLRLMWSNGTHSMSDFTFDENQCQFHH